LYILDTTAVRKVEVKTEDGTISLTDKVALFFEDTVTKFGNGAKIGCPKKYVGRRVYVIVCEKEKK
jgi:putative transposon-encoded protein